MLPLNSFTLEPVVRPFLAPLQAWTYTPLMEKVLGGTAIGNGAAGRMVKNWFVAYDGTSITVLPEDTGVPQLTLALPNVLTVSLAFDSNMAVAIAYMNAAGANLYYFSTLDNSYQTITIPGATSCRASVDDPRLFDSGASDVIFSYTLNGALYWRQQRDRYVTERLVGPAVKQILIKAGASTGQRMQFQLQDIATT